MSGVALDPDLDYRSPKQAIPYAIDQHLRRNLHTAIPATVTSYNAATQTVNCQPAVDMMLVGGRHQHRAPLVNVPVAWPSGGGFTMSFPLATGDLVLVVFCERDISGFKQSRRAGRLPSPRAFDEADGVAIPLGNAAAATPADPSRACLQTTGGGTAIMVGGGTITLKAATVQIEAADGTTRTL